MKYDVKIISALSNIELAGLKYRYIPMAKIEPFWNGQQMMAIESSPHVEILKVLIKKRWDWDTILAMPYSIERKERRTLHGQKKWTDKYLINHLKTFFELYKSMDKDGYKLKLSKRPVMILKEPFWKTRFNLNDDRIVGPEIWNGGHRCACAYVLGWKTIPGYWAEDICPGKMVCSKIEAKYPK